MSGFNMQPTNRPWKPSVIDLVCGMKVDAEKPPQQWIYKGQQYYFCSDVCKLLFQRQPEKYIPLESDQ